MKKFYNFLFLLAILVFLNSCTTKDLKINSQSVFVLLKSPWLKFNDYGFLYEGKDFTRLELYSASKALFELKINDKICINNLCYEKKLFNQKYFAYEHYENFLKDLLRQKALYNGKNKIITNCGFKQEITHKKYHIVYEVCDQKTKFIDKKAKINFSLTKINH